MHLNSPHKVTKSDALTPKKIKVEQGEYEPMCTVGGSYPKAMVKITLNDQDMEGNIWRNHFGVQTEFPNMFLFMPPACKVRLGHLGIRSSLCL